jgi:hypothetical protein
MCTLSATPFRLGCAIWLGMMSGLTHHSSPHAPVFLTSASRPLGGSPSGAELHAAVIIFVAIHDLLDFRG